MKRRYWGFDPRDPQSPDIDLDELEDAEDRYADDYYDNLMQELFERGER